MWSLKTGGHCRQVQLHWNLVFQDNWSFMTVVSQDRFHSSTKRTLVDAMIVKKVEVCACIGKNGKNAAKSGEKTSPQTCMWFQPLWNCLNTWHLSPVGPYCEYIQPPGVNPDAFSNFDDYKDQLTTTCTPSMTGGRLTFTPDDSTPDLVYYQVQLPWFQKPLQWSLYFKTTNLARKLWSYN